MRILQVCKKFPYPLKDGEAIAINQLTKAFHRLGCETSVAALNTQKHYFDISQLPRDFKLQAEYDAVDIDTSPTLSMLMKTIFKGSSFNIERFYSPNFTEMLTELCTANDFDVVQLEGLYLLNYIPAIRKCSKAKIVFRSHNVEHIIWDRLAKEERSLFGKMAYRYIGGGLKRAEKKILHLADAIVPISKSDAEWYTANNYTGPMHVCPVGLDEPLNYIPKQHANEAVRFFHIGSMDWIPNMEGLQWFVEKVWKNFTTTHPDAELHLAGRNFPKEAFANIRNVIVHGEVENAAEFITDNDVMVVPLFSGSGMRIKILEGMNQGKTVISTDIGREGIEVTDDKNILIANTASEFLLEMELCVHNKEVVNTIGTEAAAFVRREFDTLAVGQQLLDFYKGL